MTRELAECKTQIEDLIRARIGARAKEFLSAPNPYLNGRTPREALRADFHDVMKVAALAANLDATWCGETPCMAGAR